MTASQRATLAADVEPMLAVEARKRLATSTGGKSPRPKENFPEADKGQARDKAGELFNVNPHYVQQAKKLKVDLPALFEEVRAGKKTIQEAKAAIKAEAK